MNDESFYIVYRWMTTKLGLKHPQLECFAIIYGFDRDKQADFHGSLEYMAGLMNIEKSYVSKVLKSLVERNLLIKTDRPNYNSPCIYRINHEEVARLRDCTGAIGSCTGAIGSCTGAIGSCTGAIGSCTGAIGSCTGATNNIDYNIEDRIVDNIDDITTPLTPRGSFGQSENCPAHSTPENFKNFSVSVSVSNTPLVTSATAVSEKEKSSAKKEKENQPILGGLFGEELQLTAPTQKTAKNGTKNANAETAEVFRGFWNQLCVPRGFAEVKKLNKERIAKVATLVKELQEDGVSAQALFDKINNAVALYENRSNGGEDGSWFSFDWLIQGKRRNQLDTNWRLIMSGKYDNSFLRKGLVDKRSQSAQQMQRAGEFLGTLEKEHPELSPLEMLELIQQH